MFVRSHVRIAIRCGKALVMHSTTSGTVANVKYLRRGEFACDWTTQVSILVTILRMAGNKSRLGDRFTAPSCAHGSFSLSLLGIVI
jgi:hypothetical protein